MVFKPKGQQKFLSVVFLSKDVMKCICHITREYWMNDVLRCIQWEKYNEAMRFLLLSARSQDAYPKYNQYLLHLHVVQPVNLWPSFKTIFGTGSFIFSALADDT